MPLKAQHARMYEVLRGYLREMREGAGLTQRALGSRLHRPQSWVYNCETGNRRIDITEFIAWIRACEGDPGQAFRHLLERLAERAA